MTTQVVADYGKEVKVLMRIEDSSVASLPRARKQKALTKVPDED